MRSLSVVLSCLQLHWRKLVAPRLRLSKSTIRSLLQEVCHLLTLVAMVDFDDVAVFKIWEVSTLFNILKPQCKQRPR